MAGDGVRKGRGHSERGPGSRSVPTEAAACCAGCVVGLPGAGFPDACRVSGGLVGGLHGEHLGVASGLRFGVVAGVVSGVASALGTYSVFRMPPTALLVWPASVA